MQYVCDTTRCVCVCDLLLGERELNFFECEREGEVCYTCVMSRCVMSSGRGVAVSRVRECRADVCALRLI